MGASTRRLQVLIPESLHAELEVFADKYYSSNNSDLVREAVRRELEWRKSEEQAKIAASLASLYVEDETARAFTNLGLEDI